MIVLDDTVMLPLIKLSLIELYNKTLLLNNHGVHYNTFVASVVEWFVRTIAMREGVRSNLTNVVITTFPPMAICPLSSDEQLAL